MLGLVNRRQHGALRRGDVVRKEFRDGVDTLVGVVTYSDPLNLFPQQRVLWRLLNHAAPTEEER